MNLQNIELLVDSFDEIDFEKESFNLGEDLKYLEETNVKFKMNKLRSSLMDNTKEPYSKMDTNENYRKIKRNKYELDSKNLINSNFDKNSSIENNDRIIIFNNTKKNSSNRDIININFSTKNNNRIFGCCYIKNNKTEKTNENVKLEYSVFVRNLPFNPNELFIRELFSNCGKIISFYVIYK